MAWGIQYWVKKTGDFKYYDWACKITLLVGLIGFIIAGILVHFNAANFGGVWFFFILVCFSRFSDWSWVYWVFWIEFSVPH